MDQFIAEGARGDIPQIRFAEINDYLSRPSFKRNKNELPNITVEERKWLSHRVREIYTQAKKENDQGERLKLMARFYDVLNLLLCDPQERSMAFDSPESIEHTVFKSRNDCLCIATGTISERVYFENDATAKINGYDVKSPGRYMVYPCPSHGATERGRTYFRRFNEVYGTNAVNLDELVLEDL